LLPERPRTTIAPAGITMLEKAELGRTLSKKDYKDLLPDLRA